MKTKSHNRIIAALTALVLFIMFLSPVGAASAGSDRAEALSVRLSKAVGGGVTVTRTPVRS